MDDLIRVDRGDGVHLACRRVEGSAPSIVFLPGYASDMTGSKATALFGWASARGQACLLFDYSGCGASAGRFEDGTIDRWRDDALAVIDRLTDGPVVLVGSSMGGWLALLVGLVRPERVIAIIGIAAAPDFTDWGFSQNEKLALLSAGRIERPSDDDGPPMVTTRGFWQSGEANRLLQGPVAIDCPVRLLHGQRDSVVPWHHSTHLAGLVRSADVQTILVKDGDHRLSRVCDVALLLDAVRRILEDR